jgi:ribosomal protein S6--L-glutamate ligase
MAPGILFDHFNDTDESANALWLLAIIELTIKKLIFRMIPFTLPPSYHQCYCQTVPVGNKMRLAILSRNKKLYSIRRFSKEARLARIDCDIINPLECQLVIDGMHNRIVARSTALSDYDAVLPRIGASITEYGLSVVRHFEIQNVLAVNGSRAIADSRNKMRSLQVLTEAGILVPATVLTRSTRGLRSAVEAVKGLPVVLKVLQGTQGMGVMLVHTPISLGSVLETLRTLDQDVIIQQFIVEGAGRDYRAFVVGNKVVAAMMRTAPQGEFRANIHLGGEGNDVKLPPEYQAVAIKAAQVLGLEVAGVDLMESHQGPMVIEVNSSPGFEGIEKATKINVAGAIIKHVKSLIRKSKKTKGSTRKK